MSKTNDFLKTYSGIFGNQVVLKNRRGKTVMTIPRLRQATNPSKKQIEWRRKFQLASRYATNILKDPERLAAYRAKVHTGLTPYNLALRDYLRPPIADKIDALDDHGKPGEKIIMTAGKFTPSHSPDHG